MQKYSFAEQPSPSADNDDGVRGQTCSALGAKLKQLAELQSSFAQRQLSQPAPQTPAATSSAAAVED